MENISDHDLLSVWEYGFNHSLIETNLYLLYLVYPDFDLNRLASMTIGERDARLIEVRRNLFGPIFNNISNCSVCGQKVEWETTADEIQIQKSNTENPRSSFELKYKEYLIRFRLPNSYDVLELLEDATINNKAQKLIRSCIIESIPSLEPNQKIPVDLENQINHKMEEYDPQANVLMNLTCPECKNKWDVIFDITQYIWAEINDWAIRLMQDVHILASTFGWSEKDILDMSRHRRNIYISMING